ncbi:MAG: Radical domain protein [Paenibacillaceae bacterium]|nr:Radical domain protein [Paenibacillaceae bacterium]
MIAYELDNKLYVNVTNRCTNRCGFCIREREEGIGQDLWLEKEPNASEIIEAVGDGGSYSEVVFCGYGEPLLRLPEVIETAKHLKRLGKRVRVNTNGQADLIWKRKIAPELEGAVDAVSISLNAASAGHYQRLCQSAFGEEAYEGILAFAKDCTAHIPEVTLTVVDFIAQEEIDDCAAIAEGLGTRFRVRKYND